MLNQIHISNHPPKISSLIFNSFDIFWFNPATNILFQHQQDDTWSQLPNQNSDNQSDILKFEIEEEEEEEKQTYLEIVKVNQNLFKIKMINKV